MLLNSKHKLAVIIIQFIKKAVRIRLYANAIVTRAQKLTRVSFIYRTEPTTKQWRNRKTKK